MTIRAVFNWSNVRRTQFGVSQVGYCLMPNHVHWVPESSTSLTKIFARAHGRYAQYCNSLLQRSGHFWQNRFYSCALDDAHLWAALRCVVESTKTAAAGSQQGLLFPKE